jgi:hypothetical protein
MYFNEKPSHRNNKFVFHLPFLIYSVIHDKLCSDWWAHSRRSLFWTELFGLVKMHIMNFFRTVTIPRIFIASENKNNRPDGNSSRIGNSKGSLPRMLVFLKFNYENVFKMKNKPDPALLRTSYLSNKIKKRTLKSRETIPLNQPSS